MGQIAKWHGLHLSEGFFTLKQNPRKGLCMVKGCRNCVGVKKAGLCDKHHQHRFRMKSPKRSAFATLRDHARARGLDFNLTYDYFLGLTDCAGYWDLRAESRGEWATLDRVDGTKGYLMGNLRVITHSMNSVKSNRERYLPAHVQSILDRKRARAKENPHLADEVEVEENPF